MSIYEDKFREFCRLYPKASMHPYGTDNADGSWDQMCGNLMNRVGEKFVPGWRPRITGPTAWNVALASGGRNMDPAAAPAGAIHWWSSGGGTPGHTVLDLNGGGRDCGMATWAVREPLGSAIGIQSVSGYSGQKPFMRYAGWTLNYAGATYAAAATAGSGATPIDMGDVMAKYIFNQARGGLLVKGEVGGIYYPKNMEEASMLLAVYGGVTLGERQWDVARQASLNILTDMGGALGATQAGLDALYQKIAAKMDADDDPLTPDIDEAALAAAIVPLLQNSGIKAEVDAQELADVFLHGFALRLGQ